MSDRCEAVVIGTGFGGAISACRLARKWPGKVVVLERGKRYGLGEFPRAPGDFRRNFWVLPDSTPHPGHVRRVAGKGGELHGMYDVRKYDHMDVVICAGVGGGSLIYANVFLVPPDEVFADKRWPSSCKKSNLLPYYAIAKSVLGSRPIPPLLAIHVGAFSKPSFSKMSRSELSVTPNWWTSMCFSERTPTRLR